MIADEDRELAAVLGYYENKFQTKVSIMFSVIDDEDVELDLIVDTDTKHVLGMRLYKIFPANEDDDEEGEPSEEGEKPEEDEEPAGEEKEGDEDDEDEDEIVEVILYDLVLTEGAEIVGDPWIKASVKESECECEDDEENPEAEAEEHEEDEGKDWIDIIVFVKEDEEGAEVSAATVEYVEEPDRKDTFVEDAELNDIITKIFEEDEETT
jgi:hypothetical protein